MKIAVLGSGNIGGTIGRKWAARGHEVVFGVRDRESPRVQALLQRSDSKVSATSPAEAVNGAEVMLLAIPGRAVADTAAGLGETLAGKIIIDATNRVGEAVMNSLDILRAIGRTPGCTGPSITWAGKILRSQCWMVCSLTCSSVATKGRPGK